VLAGVTAALLAAQVYAAEGALEEIVVTAQKRAENVQDVPIAVSAFTAETLQERAVTSVAQISDISPNVTLDAGTPFSGTSAVISAYIRGIGSNDFAFNIDPGVGIYLDGVYLARSVGANQDLPDVERIEVLKGPQGTLFGRNTIGGAISIVTHEPGKEFSFRGDVTTGSFRLMQVRGTMDIPLSDTLRTSVTYSTKRRDGYMTRIPFPGFAGYNEEPITAFKAAGYGSAGDTEGGDDAWNARVKLVWDNGGRLKATLAGDHAEIHQGQIANSLISTFGGVFAGTYNCAIAGIAADPSCGGGPPPFVYQHARGGLASLFDLAPIFGVNVDGNPYNDRLPYDDRFLTGDEDKTYANGNNFSKLKNEGMAGTLDFDLTDNVALRSVTSFRQLYWQTGMDLDGSPLNFLHTSFSMYQRQFSQELQLLGSAFDGKLNYVGGLYYFKESGNLHDFVTFAEGLLQVDGPNNLATENYAAFGQLDFRPTDLIGITIGGRYTKEKKDFEGFQSDANGLTYKILNLVGVPPCASIDPISEACRIAAEFPNPGEPLRYYPAGVNHKDFNNFSPKVGVQLHFTDDIMAYASYSEGYKTGGWTTRLSNPLPTAPDFDEEKAKTIEVGLKSQFLDHRLQVNAAVFTTKYDGIQLNFQQGVSPTIQNAGDARIKGAELELTAAPVSGFTVNASLGYLDAYYTDVLVPAQVAANPFQAGVFPGADLPKTPKFKANLSPRYEFNVANGAAVILLGDWTHTAKMWNDTERAYLLERPKTDVFNASVTYRTTDHWELSVGATNIGDERYLTTGQAQLAGGQIYGTYNRPREWYAKLGVKF
jgi:iron complex outermembrane receptor protein